MLVQWLDVTHTHLRHKTKRKESIKWNKEIKNITRKTEGVGLPLTSARLTP